MRSSGVALFLAAFFAVAFGAETAHAIEQFPDQIKAYWHVKKLPLGGVPGKGCRVCHNDDNGGTVTKAFGLTMRQHGANKNSPTSIQAALKWDQANAFDSDHDRVSDYQELGNDGTDPSNSRSFVTPPSPKPSEEGGAGGQAGAGGDGGAFASQNTDFPPPAAVDLPPPFTHGCGTSASGGASGAGLVASALGFALFASRRRSRRR